MPWCSRTILVLLWTCSVPFCSHLLLFPGCPLSLLLLRAPLMWGSPGGSVVNNLPVNEGDAGSIPGSERSLGGRNGTPLQYSCLKKSRGQRSLALYSAKGCKESDKMERLSMHAYPLCCWGSDSKTLASMLYMVIHPLWWSKKRMFSHQGSFCM